MGCRLGNKGWYCLGSRHINLSLGVQLCVLGFGPRLRFRDALRFQVGGALTCHFQTTAGKAELWVNVGSR